MNPPSQALCDRLAYLLMPVQTDGQRLFSGSHHGFGEASRATLPIGGIDASSPFSIAEKPNHGSPGYAREVPFQKITNRIEGTRAAADPLGVG
jgi:hypothetical protein